MPTIIINELQLACMNICWIKNVVTTQSELILKYTTDFIKNADSSLTVNKEYWSSYRICIVSASVDAVVYKFF